MRILVIEDDRETAGHIIERLGSLSHHVDHRVDGRDLITLTADDVYDVAIVDRMLPGLDGLECVAALRDTGLKIPVLFLTALDGIDDRVEGLEAGGDDYLVKPFAMTELVARVAALARRSPELATPTTLRIADLEMDLIARRVWRNGQIIALQPREFKLLEYLMRNHDRVVTRTMLLDKVWDFHFNPRTNIVETHVSRLRAKVDSGQATALIKTMRGSGYMLRVPT